MRPIHAASFALAAAAGNHQWPRRRRPARRQQDPRHRHRLQPRRQRLDQGAIPRTPTSAIRCGCRTAPGLYCKTSCSETLRVNTIDVWANVDNANPIGVGTLQQECGIAGCLHWEWGF